MKEKKNVSILVEGSDQSKSSNRFEDQKSIRERLKKPLIFGLMGIVFMGCMYLIFKPSPDKKEIENIGLNESVPQASVTVMQSAKQKAYEQEMLEQKEEEKRHALVTLSDYWNSKEDEVPSDERSEEQENDSNGNRRYGNSALKGYRNTQRTLSSFYQDDNSETIGLRKQVDELKEKLAENDVPKNVTVTDQLALMEKSYQMASKYFPSGTNKGQSVNIDSTVDRNSVSNSKIEYFEAFSPTSKKAVSNLHRGISDSIFLNDWSEKRNSDFYTAGAAKQVKQTKNSVKACIEKTQTIIGESGVRLRLLEPAQTPNHTIPKGTIITAIGKFQGGRLQLKVSSIELNGNIIPVDIAIYDIDGQQGLYVPYSQEMNALTEMAGNMSQTSGTSVMLTQSAGQQVAADLSRGVVQGISGYFSKKIKTTKLTLKAGYQVFLVSKK
ncbi:conjugative transposon protein TraM [Flavobacterium adhaerens]|uniref:conjugative transposon protein TraM n=1 Tax=Flavobacterium adhaerens TaxID=3149043 RepID=UPI0032B31964